MAKWRCKKTGNIVEFKYEHDDATMKGHEEYELVVEGVEEEPQPKRVGRPPKSKDE